jgi:hypothetical protein
MIGQSQSHTKQQKSFVQFGLKYSWHTEHSNMQRNTTQFAESENST